MARWGVRDFFPPFAHRRPVMYVYFALMLGALSFIAWESTRSSEISSADTQTVVDEIEKYSPYETLYPTSFTIRGTTNIYDIMFPDEENPIPVGEYTYVPISLNYPSSSKSDISYDVGLRFVIPEKDKDNFSIGYPGNGTEFAISAKKEASHCKVDIYNREDVHLGEYTFDIGRKTVIPQHKLVVQKDGKTDGFPRNSVVFLEDNIMPCYVEAFQSAPLFKPFGFFSNHTGVPSFDNDYGQHIDEMTLRRLFPSFVPDVHLVGEGVSYDAEAEAILLSKDAHGTIEVTNLGASISFTVGEETLPEQDTPVTIKTTYWDSRSKTYLDFDEGKIESNDQAFSFRAEVLEGAYAGEASLRLINEDPSADVTLYYQYDQDRSTQLGFPVRYPDCAEVYYLPKEGSFSLRFASLLSPEKVICPSFTVARPPKPRTVASSTLLVNGTPYDPALLDDLHKGDALVFEGTVVYNDGTIPDETIVRAYSGSSNIKIDQIDKTHVRVTIIAEGDVAFDIQLAGEATYHFAIRIGTPNIFNDPTKMQQLARKILGHALVYLLTSMATGAFFFYWTSGRKSAHFWPLYSLAVSFPICALSEFIQMFIPSRGASFEDIGYNFLGYLVGLGITVLIALVMKFIWKKKAERATDYTEEEKETLRLTGARPKNKK